MEKKKFKDCSVTHINCQEEKFFLKQEELKSSLNQFPDSNQTKTPQKRKFSALEENSFEEEAVPKPNLSEEAVPKPNLSEEAVRKPKQKKTWQPKECAQLQKYLILAKKEKSVFWNRFEFIDWTNKKGCNWDRDKESISSHMYKIAQRPNHACSIVLEKVRNSIFKNRTRNSQKTSSVLSSDLSPNKSSKKKSDAESKSRKIWEEKECKELCRYLESAAINNKVFESRKEFIKWGKEKWELKRNLEGVVSHLGRAVRNQKDPCSAILKKVSPLIFKKSMKEK